MIGVINESFQAGLEIVLRDGNLAFLLPQSSLIELSIDTIYAKPGQTNDNNSND